jgi:hypothetical protein
MKKRHLILVTLVCTLFSATLSAQEQAPQETSVAPSVHLPQNPASSTNRSANAQPPSVRTRGPYFYSSAKQHPLTPRDVSMREAVESLGIDKHRFVLCKLKDGSHLVGGIGYIHFASFTISQGIMNGQEIKYSELREAPQLVPAVGEHLANGLKWTGLVAACVALSPLVVVLYPLVLAGVLTD